MRAFVALPSERTIRSGTPAESIDVPGKDPMFFAGEGIAAPLSLLIRAYPGGPESVPSAATRAVVVDHDRTFALDTERPDPGRIVFHIASAGDAAPSTSMDGELAWPRSAPLSDDEPLDGWTTRSGEAFARLGDARR